MTSRLLITCLGANALSSSLSNRRCATASCTVSGSSPTRMPRWRRAGRASRSSPRNAPVGAILVVARAGSPCDERPFDDARGQDSIGNDKLDEWFQDYMLTVPRLAAALKGADALSLSEIFAQDLRNATLLVRPGEEAFRFSHTSVREYFLANALYTAVINGIGETAWQLPPTTPETLEFILQRHAIQDEFDRKAFEAKLPRLMEPGRSLETRRLAFSLWRLAYAKGAPPIGASLSYGGVSLSGGRAAGTPSPLVGEGWGGGSGDSGTTVPHTTTPTPDPSPQGGG